METPQVKLDKVTKAFGAIKAVDDLSFQVEKGEFVYIMGPSGAGKTTIMRLILHELIPDTGAIFFEGHNITQLTEKEVPVYRQKIGMVFQDFKLLPERTVRENVEVALAVLGIPEQDWKARVDQVLKLTGLLSRSELFPAQLSGGELQRTSLARALAVNPKLLLADEPTGNLDWETTDGLMALLEKINKEGKTIIMATHNKMIVDKFKKRIIRIKEGKLVH